jgi:phage tail-like protein
VVAQNVNGKALLKSNYIQYLPALYRDDEFMGQFLLIFESVMKPLENSVNNLELYLDPQMTPESLLTWLGSWVGLALDPTLPLERRRELVKRSAELYRWRGTRHGLFEYLRIYTGTVPEISEYIPGMQLDSGTKLGIETKLGSSGKGHHFTVTLYLDENHTVSTDAVKAIIDSQKPAQAVYTLDIRRNGRKVEKKR